MRSHDLPILDGPPLTGNTKLHPLSPGLGVTVGYRQRLACSAGLAVCYITPHTQHEQRGSDVVSGLAAAPQSCHRVRAQIH